VRPHQEELSVSETERVLGDVTVDVDNLYREETFTDLKVASLKRLTPIKLDGSDDPSRAVLWMGQTQLMSQVGPVPVACRIEASSLEEATQKFPDAVNRAVQEMVDEARQLQRDEASRIVIPNAPKVGKIIS
jgi:hypothetical protein